MNRTEVPSRTASAPRRWPLILIALPAAVAIWSGWVGLGGMCGFGLVQPFPGIVSWHLDTAITLPVGVEAYGAFALGVWIHPAGIPGTARDFARRSAVGALGTGMAGQVIFHLLAAAGRTRAPWPVVVLVSCLPVIVLGFGAGLTHLLRADESEHEQEQEREPETVPEQPKQRVAHDAESAARVALAATIEAGNPLTKNQLVTRFGLPRPVAAKVHAELLPEPAGPESPPGLAMRGRDEAPPPLVPAASTELAGASQGHVPAALNGSAHGA